MPRFMAVALVPWVFAAAVFVSAQTSTSNNPVSDPQALALASKSMLALTGGASVKDVTLAANVISAPGQNGTATLEANGNGESRIDLNLSGTTRSDVRNVENGEPSGGWINNSEAAKHYANHNCWTDAAWFFPALSSLSQTSNASFVFKYLGQTQHDGISTQHIRLFQAQPGMPAIFQRLSAMDFYLNSATLLPEAVAFNIHPDKNAGVNLPVNVEFSNYQVVQGATIPMRIRKYQEGTLMVDITVSTVSLNQGLDSTVFSLNQLGQ